VSILDSPEFNASLFFPRADPSGPAYDADDLFVPTGDSERLHVRIHVEESAMTTLLFFHGNGEIAADYDGLRDAYRRLGVELVIADYRGYGKSTGVPMLRDLLPDAHAALAYLRDEERVRDRLVVMGRSLGSLPAIELAATDPDVAGLIVESGFADPKGIMERRGLPASLLTVEDAATYGNGEKMKRVRCPVLVLHGAEDDLISADEGRALHAAAPGEKRLVILDGVGHNDILFGAPAPYFEALRTFLAAN